MYNQKYHSFKRFYNHKFGFHINGPRQDAFEAVLKMKPRIVKTLDFSVDMMKRIRQEIPDVFLIGRLAVHPQDFGQFDGRHESMPNRIRRAEKKGQAMADRLLREEVNREVHHINGRPIFHAWESLNEIFPESVDQDSQKLYDAYQVAFGEKMKAAGFEPIGMNFATGNFTGPQLVDNFSGTLETYKYLGFHEYDWPRMDRLHQIGLSAPDTPKNRVDRVPLVGEGQGNDGMWLCLRYRRMLFNGVRQKYGDRHVGIITECGMTQGVQQGHDIGPWAKENTLPRDYADAKVQVPIPVEDYWQTLQWYNSEIMKDDYIMGACLFVTGAAGLPEWETFEHLGPIMERLERFQKEVPNNFDPSNAAPLVDPSVEVTVSTTSARRPAAPSPDTDTPAIIRPEPEPVESTVERSEPGFSGPAARRWTHRLSEGRGLPLLVGDIGVANTSITIVKPNGQLERLTSGSKPEHGVGGFEVYASMPGNYRVQFLDEQFELLLKGRFTKVRFEPPQESEPVVEDTTEDTTTEEAPVSVPSEPERAVPGGWIYHLTEGPGLPILVGDIGVPHERITIVKPNGARVDLRSGSKPEHGAGGFETYAHLPGRYDIQFLGQSIKLQLNGRFTKAAFQQQVTPGGVSVTLIPRERRISYRVGEKVYLNMGVTNMTQEPITFGILGLLTNTGQFHTSWDHGTIGPGRTFTHEDGLSFSRPGRYTIQLSICFSRKADCMSHDGDWERYEPKVQVTVR